MAEIVDMEEFKARKLKRLVDEWTDCMDRIAVLQKAGKDKFAEKLIAKAKVLRAEIDTLRKPRKVPEATPRTNRSFIIPAEHVKFTFSGFDGLGGADLGFPKHPQMTPEPENN